MEQCKDCWMKEFKNTKDRPIYCASCELKYYLDELFSSFKYSLTIELPTKFIKFVTKIIKKI